MEYPDSLLPAESHYIGPTWRRYRSGGWYLPEKTLGWGILNWLAEYVKSPDGSGGFLPTLEQARFLLWWYAVDDSGEYVYRTGVLRRCKGWGKDPLAAAMALVELSGPVAFSHFDDKGNAVGKTRHAAWVQVAAVSQEQTKNTFSLFPVMISAKMKDEYGLDINKFLIYSQAGGRIEAVTSSPHSMEGNRPTFVIQNETQWWVDSNQGHDMANVIEGNVTKIPGSRKLSICNAHIPGEDSVAERDYVLWQQIEGGQAVDVGFFYDALEAPADTPVSEIPPFNVDPEGHEKGLQLLREGLEIARGDSKWLPIESVLKSVLDARNDVIESRRKFLNQVNAQEDSWISPQEWDACWADVRLQPGDKITLGFDGAKTDDYAALVACRIEDAALFPIKVWNPKSYPKGEVPREDVDAMVQWCFSRFKVLGFRADVSNFESYVDMWSVKYRKHLVVNASPNNPVAFDMRNQTKRFAFDCEKFLDAVLERNLCHDGNKILRQHILNAHKNPTTYDAISIRKASKDSSRKIDAAVCAVLAFAARQDVLMSNKNRSRGMVVLR